VLTNPSVQDPLHNRAFFGIDRIACLTPKSAKTSSAGAHVSHARERRIWPPTSSEERVECDRSVVLRKRVRPFQQRNGSETYVFDESAHAGPGDTTTTEYLNGVPCGVLSTLCTIALQEAHRPYCVDKSALNH